jgi:hypothetical protein
MTHVQIAQKVVHTIVQMNVASRVQTLIDENTELAGDSITATCTGLVAGHLVANQTDKITNPMVEKTAEYIRTHRPKINFRKSQES